MASFTTYFQASAAGGGDGSLGAPYNDLWTAINDLDGRAAGSDVKLVILPDATQQFYNAPPSVYHDISTVMNSIEIEAISEVGKFEPWICSYVDIDLEEQYWEEVEAGETGWEIASGTNIWRFKIDDYISDAKTGSLVTTREYHLVTMFKSGDPDPVNGDGSDPYQQWFAANGPYSSIGRADLGTQSKDQPGWIPAYGGDGTWGANSVNRPWKKPSADYQYGAQSSNGTLNADTILAVYAESNPATYYSKIRVSWSSANPIVLLDCPDVKASGRLRFYHCNAGITVQLDGTDIDCVLDINLGDREDTHGWDCKYVVSLGGGGSTNCTFGGDVQNIGSHGCRGTVRVNGNTGGVDGTWDTALRVHSLRCKELGNGPETGGANVYLLSNDYEEQFNAPIWIYDVKGEDSSGDSTGIEAHGAAFYKENSWRGEIRCYNVEANNIPAIFHDNNAPSTEAYWIWNIITDGNVAKLAGNSNQSILYGTDELSMNVGFSRIVLPTYGTWPHNGIHWPESPREQGAFYAGRNHPYDTDPPYSFNFTGSGLHNIELRGDGTQYGLSGYTEPVLGGIDAITYNNVSLVNMLVDIQDENGNALPLPTGVGIDSSELVDANGFPQLPGFGTDNPNFVDVNGNRRDFRGHPRSGFNRNAYEYTSAAPATTTEVGPVPLVATSTAQTVFVSTESEAINLQNKDGAVWFEWGSGTATANTSLLIQANHGPIGKPPTESRFSILAFDGDVPFNPASAAAEDYR